MKFILLDPSIKADVESWKVKLANYSSQFVGKTLVYLNGTFEECRFRECNLGNLICDAMVSHQSLCLPLDILGYYAVYKRMIVLIKKKKSFHPLGCCSLLLL